MPEPHFAALGLTIALAFGQGSPANPEAEPPARFAISRIEQAPVIDGRLDDPAWQRISPVTDFWTMRPVDDRPASERTEAYVAYDRTHLYVAIRAYEEHAGSVRASLSNRDQIFSDDVVGLLLDTFHDLRRAYLIFVNPLGIQTDGVTVEGQNDDYSIDLVWQSAGQRTDAGFVVELAIPFRSLRFPNEERQTWGIAILRLVQHSSEQHVFPRLDIDRNCIICQSAELAGLEGIRPGRTFEILPTVTGLQRGSRDGATASLENEPVTVDAGLGLKVGLTSNLTADLTLNPDFSQVEADAGQVEVNQRFALFFSEKRPFFLEGQEIFQAPFFLVHTRTVFDPLVAAKLTGKVGGTLVGALAALDETPIIPRGDAVPAGEPAPSGSAFFGIFRMRQDLARTSSLGLIVTDREFAGSYNRVAGVDAQARFGGRWNATVQGVWAETRNLDGTRLNDPAFRAEISRSGEHLNLEVFYNDLGPDFRADAGFIRRTDLREGGLFVGYQERPDGKVVLRWGPRFFYDRLYDHAGTLQDQVVRPSLFLQLARQSFVNLGVARALERFAETDFHKTRYFLFAESAPWKLWSGGVYVEQGDQINFDPEDAFLGFSRDFQAWSTIRPNDNLKFELSFTKSTFWREGGEGGGERVFDVNILRSKTTYQFSKELSVRAIGEWNSFSERLALNLLVSYVASPGTVFFVGFDDVLQDGADSGLQTAHRAIFLKGSYLWRL
ncbi:MAG: carbohydrate binding family 9 domain-containing protein [Gemmatimonadetes bacterium]|nr:carbohydrate binding family 9 domain-containing protein [Gemmatimonadota bacterium]